MTISDEYIVDYPSPDNPLLVKNGEDYPGKKQQQEDEEPDQDTTDEENRVIWKGENVD
jgi:hypothetical protein